MMDLITELEKLLQKYRDNDYRLSKSDSLLAREKLLELIEDEENWKQAIDFIIAFPGDIGITVYVNYYRTISKEQRMRLNRQLVKNEQFQSNDNFRSVRRGVTLLKELLRIGASKEEINFLLKNINRLILEQTGPNISENKIEGTLEVFTDNYRIEELEERLKEKKEKNEELKSEVIFYQNKIEELKEMIAGLKEDLDRLRSVKKEINFLLQE